LTPEQTRTLVDEVLASTKRGWADFNCKKCGASQRQQAEIPDARAVASALSDLANQAFGRPQEASSVDVEPIKFVRLTNMDDLASFKGSDPKSGPKRTKSGAVARQRGAASRKRGSYQGKTQPDKAV